MSDKTKMHVGGVSADSREGSRRAGRLWKNAGVLPKYTNATQALRVSSVNEVITVNDDY